MKLPRILFLLTFAVFQVTHSNFAFAQAEEETETSGAITSEEPAKQPTKSPFSEEEDLDKEINANKQKALQEKQNEASEAKTTLEKTEKKTPQKKTVKKSEPKSTEGKSKFGFELNGGFPTGYGVGLNYITSDSKWTFGADYSTFSIKTGTAPEVKASLVQMKVVGRYHPWASAFFTGLYLGTQTINFEGTDTYLGERITAKLEIKNTLITPHIGWQWLWDSGVMFGMELGAQINTNATTTFTDPTNNPLILNDDTYNSDKNKIKDQGKQLGSSTIPHIMLVRLGYMF